MEEIWINCIVRIRQENWTRHRRHHKGHEQTFLFQQDSHPFSCVCRPVHLCSHTNTLSCSPASKRVVVMAAGAALPSWVPGKSPLTSLSLTGVPADSLHTLLHAPNDGYVSVSASTLSACNFTHLEQTHTCFTLHLQNGRNKVLSTEILLKHATGRPGDIIKQLNQYTFSLETLPVTPALLDLLDSKLQSVILSRITEMPVVN